MIPVCPIDGGTSRAGFGCARYSCGVSSEASERTRLLDEIERDLSGVSAAMERLDNGIYGTCEVCAGPIDDERLRSMPLSARCSACPTA
jgi:DnaK suppressor protein